MKAKAKQDPIFGTDALKELGEKAKAKTKAFPALNPHRKRRFRWTEHGREIMRYLYAEQDE